MSTNISVKLAGLVVVTTLIFTVLGLIFPDFLRSIQFPILGLLLITIGLPHGATDFLLFRRIQKADLSKGQILTFFTKYVLTILGFLVLWLTLPLLAFVIFIIISCYHFGQSNWENIDIPKKYSLILNILWGAFAVGGSVLWHWDESKIVIGQIIRFVPEISQNSMNSIQIGLLVFNIFIILILNFKQIISHKRLWSELGKITVLSLLFYFTPMLVGFALYFALWHSLSSLNSQMIYYQKLWPNFNLIQYYKQAAPYTLIAIIGLGLMILGHPYVLPDASIISTFVVFIASVTLPHIFLVDESYH